jgi:hypothetical protein
VSLENQADVLTFVLTRALTIFAADAVNGSPPSSPDLTSSNAGRGRT